MLASFGNKCIVVLATWLAVFTAAPAIYGQAMDGGVVGNLTDATGAAIPNGRLTLVNLGTNVTYTAPSDGTGVYRFGETRMFEFRAEAYNAFNNTQYTPGFVNQVAARLRLQLASVANIFQAGHPNFNRPDLAFASNSRTMQLVARFQF